MAQGNVLSHLGTRFALPIGTTRVPYDVSIPLMITFCVHRPDGLQEFEEVTVPPARPVPPRSTERLIPVSELEDLARGSFPVRYSCLSGSLLSLTPDRDTLCSIGYNP